MAKTDVYSWRISPHLKSALEEAARAEQKSMAALLEEIAEEWLERSRVLPSGPAGRQSPELRPKADALGSTGHRSPTGKISRDLFRPQ